MKLSQKSLKTLAIALLCMFFSIYALHHIVGAAKEKTELFTVTQESVENTLMLSGLVFRDETVLYGAGTSCSYNYADGEKVGAGSTVALSYYIENAELRARMETVKSKIAILEASESRLHIDLREVDEQITELRTEIAINSARGDTAFLDKAQNELLVLLHKRELAEKNKRDFGTELAALRAELTSLSAAASGISKAVISETSGYFYSYTDGYEGIYTSTLAENMTLSVFNNLMQAQPQKSASAIGKVASVGKWYFVCKTTVEKAEEIVADETYNCVFTDNAYKGKLPMLAENKIVDYTSGEVLIVFSCANMPSGFDFSRTQRIEVAVAEIAGLRVPAASVRVENGQTIVYIIKEGVCRPRKINILFEKNGYCFVSLPENGEYLMRYDRIIIGEKNLYDGKVIDY